LSIHDLTEFFGFLRVSFFLKRHYLVLDLVWIWYLPEKKTFSFGRGLNKNIAVIEKGRDYAHHLGCDVLDAAQFQLAHRAMKKPRLFDVNYAKIGDDPNVEIVVDPDQEKNRPDEHEKNIFQKRKKQTKGRIYKSGEKPGQIYRAGEQNNQHQENQEHLLQNIKPVPMNHQDNLFSIFLSVEMKFFVFFHQN